MKGWALAAALMGSVVAVAVAGTHPPESPQPDPSAPRMLTPDDTSGWRAAGPGYSWSFPDDHGPHDGYKTEWWYFTGILDAAAADGAERARFGYQFTIFKVGVAPGAALAGSRWAASSVFMGHVAISDLESGRHEFREVLYRTSPLLARFGTPGDTLIAWSVGPPGISRHWQLTHAEGAFRFQAFGEGVGISMTTRPSYEPLYQGPGGYSRKSQRTDRGSMYYSFTRLLGDGTLEFDGRTWLVEGTSWMDHEFSSNPLEPDQVGWDWLSLRMSDGTDVMAFQLRGRDGRPDYASATTTDTARQPTYLTPADWTLRPGATWTSEDTDGDYPIEWTLTLPDRDGPITVKAVFPEQENVSRRVPGLFYWEGVVEAFDPTGFRIGEGYLEMTGYGSGSRPAL